MKNKFMNKNDIKKNEPKSLNEYFTEFKKLMEHDRIWIELENNININIKTDYKFFIHMIGIEKIPVYKKLRIDELLKKIENEEITFLEISKKIKATILKNRDRKQEMRYVENKIKGLKKIKEINKDMLIKIFHNFLIDNKRHIFENIPHDFFWYHSDGKCVFGFLLKNFENKPYALQNFCCFKSFVLISCEEFNNILNSKNFHKNKYCIKKINYMKKKK